MRGWIFVLCLVPAVASAQELSASERASALARVRAMADCVQQSNAQLQRVLTLVRESEEQRDRARDERVRVDAERAVEALIARAAQIQRDARQCVGGSDLPWPGTTVEVRPPPPDEVADSVGQPGNTVRTVETDAPLGDNIRVVRGEQVDGEGRIEHSLIRSAMRGIQRRLSQCYDQYLVRGSIAALELELEFTISPSGSVGSINVVRSGEGDATLEGCVRTAARSLRVSRPPVGGEAVFGYRLRFGR
jgi:hypothetical protein